MEAITRVAAIDTISNDLSTSVISTNAKLATVGFSDMLNAGVNNLENQLQTNQVDMQSLANGNPENLHQIMMRLEESRLSFQFMLQVRNRLLESYQDIMKMQI